MRCKTICAAVVGVSFSMLVSSTAHAVLVELTVTGFYASDDFFISPTETDPPTGVPEENDDLVFGVAPSDGSTTFTLRIDTASASFFPAGHLSNGTDTLTHDWYGYTDVELVGTHTFGTASWDTSSILTGLIGPDGTTAALWTDADIASANPTRLSFRMFGSGDGITADLFVGSRTPTTIGTSFLIHEFFAGEAISASPDAYTAISSAAGTTGAIPEPITATLGLMGLGVLGMATRRRVA